MFDISFINNDKSLKTVKLLLDCGANPYGVYDNNDLIDICPIEECRKLIFLYRCQQGMNDYLKMSEN